MKYTDYPQEISTLEARWGFELLLIEGIGDLMAGQRNPIPVPVVAKILTASDILIKVFELKRRVMYSHRRFGHFKRIPRNFWTPLSHLQEDLRQFIFDFNAGTQGESFGYEIVPARFKYRKAGQ
ncbi:MAG: hypothetical protein ACLQVY_03970 [Limisphaerales bacterium]